MRAREPRAIPIARILRFHAAAAWRYPALVVGCLLASPLTILVDTVAPPLIVARVLDRLTRGDYQPDRLWASFHLELMAYAVVVVVGFVVTWRVIDAFLWRLEAGVQRDMAQRCFGHLIGQSADFHANNFGGSLVSQTNKLMGSYVRIQDTTIFQLIPLTCMIGSIVAIMSVQAPVFAAALAVFSVVFVITAMFVSKPVRRAGADHAATDSAQTGNLADAVSNVMAVKAFAREAHERRRFAGATDRTRDSMLRLSRAHMRQMAWFGSLTSIISIGAFVVATDGVVSRGPGVGTAIGTMFLIVNYTISTVQQLWDFSSSGLRTYNRAFGDATDMLAILERESEIQDPAEPEPSRIRAGEVRFDRVVFRHAGSRDNLFDGLNLRIEPGERVGLVGHSGAGKTSFTRLLLRFSDLDGGRILLDGQDIARVTQADLREAIAYVPQEPLLFHRSIAENIAYGRLEADRCEIELAATRANVTQFVEDLPDGFETLVGERGVKLSGGQRQRIAIARAMLKDAPILLLDEATSALDSESEVLIQEALWALMEGRTTIVIAHRLSTIQRMDRIIVLDAGRIAEVGSHQELLEQPDGIYASFWAHQSGGFTGGEQFARA